MVRVVLNNKEFPDGRLSVQEWVDVLAETEPPVIFMNDLVDPLVYPRFGNLLRALDRPYVLFSSLAGYHGFRSLKVNVFDDMLFLKKCVRLCAYHISPRDGGGFSLQQFLERAKHLITGGYPIKLFLPERVELGSVPYVLWDWDWHDDQKVEIVSPWKEWPTTTSGRYKDGQTCQGERVVIGPNGFTYPCVVAAGSSFGRGVYRGNDGRAKCSLRRCPNNERDAETFGSHRFVTG